MSPLGPCVYCGATLESTIAHVCPTHPGGHPPKTFWAGREPDAEPDPITRRHYYQFPGGVEAADIAEHLPFNLGSVVKYAARAGRKENADAIDDCEKGIDFFRREIRRLRRTK